MNKYAMGLALMVAATSFACAADAQRQAEVAQRGAHVMPFALNETTHIFTKTSDGGVQRVIVKDPANTAQIRLIRAHLKDLQGQFQHGDFSDPAKIHGHDMPGLAQLSAARPGELSVQYKEIQRGAELVYQSRNPELVTAIGAWFDAQVSDHGADAMAGHMHHHPGMTMEHHQGMTMEHHPGMTME